MIELVLQHPVIGAIILAAVITVASLITSVIAVKAYLNEYTRRITTERDFDHLKERTLAVTDQVTVAHTLGFIAARKGEPRDIPAIFTHLPDDAKHWQFGHMVYAVKGNYWHERIRRTTIFQERKAV